ncbi:MAG: porin [Burkholderiales bacterium]|nr:MAG: porin [Burkholderiales bacterium]
MKKSLLAVAVAAALPAAAFAQSNVTLYGIMDAGVGFNDRDGPNTSNAMVVNSGYQSTSRLGVRGSEDLGGGLRATFNLEMGNRVDEGISDSDIAGRTLWQRRSVVGLAGGFGEVRLGRDYTPGFSAAGATDVMGYGLFGNWLTYTAGAGGITTRASNAIWYTSPSFGNTKCMAMPAPTECNAFSGGLTLSAFYGTGETDVTPKDAGDAWGLAVVYRGGPALAQIHYQELNDAAGDAKKEMGAGLGWNFGAFRVTTNYGSTETPAGVKTKGLSLGAGIRVGAGEILAQVMQIKRDSAGDPKATVMGLAYVHPLSKRTNLYATYGMARNNDAGSFAVLASDNSVAPAAVGSDPKGFAVGVRHMF